MLDRIHKYARFVHLAIIVILTIFRRSIEPGLAGNLILGLIFISTTFEIVYLKIKNLLTKKDVFLIIGTYIYAAMMLF